MMLLYNGNREGLDMSLLRYQIQVQSQWHQFRLFVTCIPGSLGTDQMAKARQRHMVIRPWYLSKRHPREPTFARELCALPAFRYDQSLFSLLDDDRSLTTSLTKPIQIRYRFAQILIHPPRAREARFPHVRPAERYMPPRRLPSLARL